MSRRRLVLVALLATCSIAPFLALRASGGETQEIVVFAATSLREAFQNFVLTFEKQHPNLKVRCNFAGSQDLRVQIEHGATADVFASADAKQMKLLATQGMVIEREVFARNLPVLVVTKNNPAKVRTFADLPKATHLVVGAAFGRRGLFGGTLERLGWTPAFSVVAVIMAQVFVSAPFYLQAAVQAFGRLDPNLLAVARSLGASPPRLFARVVLPLARPWLIGGAAMSWEWAGTRQRRNDAMAWLERFGIGHLADRSPLRLSGGERQRVALARALASSPKALLLDEPTASLDVEARVEVRAFLAESIRSLGLPTILVTHDAMDVAALASRVAVLEKGQVVACGLLRDICKTPPTSFASRLFSPSTVLGAGVIASLSGNEGVHHN